MSIDEKLAVAEAKLWLYWISLVLWLGGFVLALVTDWKMAAAIMALFLSDRLEHRADKM